MNSLTIKQFIQLTFHTFCLLVIVALLNPVFASDALGQKLENVKIDISTESARIPEVLSHIEAQTDFRFVYDGRIDDIKKTYSLSYKRVSLRSILELLAKDADLTFKRANWIISIDVKKKVEKRVVEQDIFQQVTGKVIDELGNPLPGATILEKGTSNGTTTDFNGNFTINVSNEDAILVISYIGYDPRQVRVAGNTALSITLTPSANQLEDVVVIGYGAQKKINLTGSVGVITGAELESRPITQGSQALYGLVPGVFVNASSGEAGNDAAEIQIRGIGTLGNSNPLVLIDGIEGPLDNINPNDIESISVLKDAASAAIYGSRGANGVVLVTTKRANRGDDLTISYNYFAGISSPTVLPDMVEDPRQYMELYREAIENGGGTVAFTEDDISRYESIGSTDWLNRIFDNSALEQLHSLSISGGSEKVASHFSISFLDQEGIITNNELQRANSRLNLDYYINDRIKFGTSMAYTYESGDLASKSGGAFGNLDPTTVGDKGPMAFEAALVQHPIVPVFDVNGGYATLERSLGMVSSRNNGQGLLDLQRLNLVSNDFLGSYFIEYQPIAGLNLRATAAINFQQDHFVDERGEVRSNDWVTGELVRIDTRGSSLIDLQRSIVNFTGILQASYEKRFGRHYFQGLLGFNQEESTVNSTTIRQQDFAIPNQLILGAGSSTTNAFSNVGEWGLQSYFGRINYSFEDKYLFEANLRHDGSSRFGANNRWATFPSFSAGWILSSEDFWPTDIVNYFKIRGSWGKLGNQNTTNFYPFASQVSLDNNYIVNNGLVSGGALTRLGNEDLKWEETTTTNIGFNLSMLNSKLSIEADYFQRKSEDVLTPLPNSLVSGVQEPTLVNAATVENKGWEAAINYNQSFNDLSFSIGFNVTNVKNEVVEINPDLSDNEDIVDVDALNNVWFVRGAPVNAIYGFDQIGIFPSDEEISQAPDHSFIGTPSAGDFRFRDVNGDGVIDSNDRVVIGNRNPEWIFGGNINVKYKNFDFSSVFQGIGGADVFLSRHVQPFPFAGLRKVWIDRWTPENPSLTRPRLWRDRTGYNGSTNGQPSKYHSFWVENRAYIRMKNIQVGYTFPSKLLDSTFLTSARIYVNGENLLTFTDFEDFDPERNALERHSTATLPQVKTISLGANIKF